MSGLGDMSCAAPPSSLCTVELLELGSVGALVPLGCLIYVLHVLAPNCWGSMSPAFTDC